MTVCMNNKMYHIIKPILFTAEYFALKKHAYYSWRNLTVLTITHVISDISDICFMWAVFEYEYWFLCVEFNVLVIGVEIVCMSMCHIWSCAHIGEVLYFFWKDGFGKWPGISFDFNLDKNLGTIMKKSVENVLFDLLH